MTRPTITLRKPLSEGTWIVWRPGTSRVRKRHHTEAAAWSEAYRLRKENPGALFIVCKGVGFVGDGTLLP